MFSYIFMKILERRPRSYDRRMERLTGGRITELKQAVVREVPPGSHVLEMGCGTGELARMIAKQGSTVEGFDLSPAMIAVAVEEIERDKLQDRVNVMRMGVEELDRFAPESFDAVVSTLLLSELTDDERRFALHQSFRIIRPGGLLVIADEVQPLGTGARVLQDLVRFPLLLASYLVTGSVTRPIADLEGDVRSAGFRVEKLSRSHGGAVALITAIRPVEDGIS